MVIIYLLKWFNTCYMQEVQKILSLGELGVKYVKEITEKRGY